MGPIFRLSVFLGLFSAAQGPGLLILYRPYEISSACAFSHHLRYDLSFGMGMSDTITLKANRHSVTLFLPVVDIFGFCFYSLVALSAYQLLGQCRRQVFHTLQSTDYECLVELVADSPEVYLIIVILFPNDVGYNCIFNRDVFVVLKGKKCFRLCDYLPLKNRNSPYYVYSVPERFRFRFTSNSSINADMNAHMYQVTATAARRKPRDQKQCYSKNETVCTSNGEDYCFTNGVVCDGIKNCGVANWFDERKADCGIPVERLGFAPVFAVSAGLLCAALAAGHLLMRYLPPLANSFFVFNANEDNRLCMDSVFKSPDEGPSDIENVRRASLVPVSSSSSSSNISGSKPSASIFEMQKLKNSKERQVVSGQQGTLRRTTAMRSMTAKIQEKFRAAVAKSGTPDPPSTRKKHRKNETFDV